MRRLVLALALIGTIVSPVLATHIYHARQLIWEVPAGAKSVVVEIFDDKGNYVTYYTVSSYTTIKPYYKLRVTAK
jgi:hypothetical protein